MGMENIEIPAGSVVTLVGQNYTPPAAGTAPAARAAAVSARFMHPATVYTVHGRKIAGAGLRAETDAGVRIGVRPSGDLPQGCAAVCNASVNVQRLAVEAAVRGDDMLLRQAMMMDPLTGAVCNPPEIWQMTDEMLVAGARWLPQYKAAIAAARKRLASPGRIRTRAGYRGAARLRVKTVADMKRHRNAATKNAAAADKAMGKYVQRKK